MESWIIVREGRGNEGIALYYVNEDSGYRHLCGRLPSDVPDMMVVDWIFTHGKPRRGNTIILSDGTKLMYQQPMGLVA